MSESEGESDVSQELEAIESFFDDGEAPYPKDLAKNMGITRDKARDFVSALVRQSELDDEARSPSGDEHLSKVINRPIKRAIEALERDVEELTRIIQDNQSTNAVGDIITPEEARGMLHKTVRALVELKGSLKQAGVGDHNITIDIGSVFSEALNNARSAIIDVTPEQES